MPASLPRGDTNARLAALRSYGILDTEPEEIFDDLTRLASRICETPISLVSFVDSHRQWFKSTVGLGVRETPREMAFCAHALSNPDKMLIVRDALEDERFANNALVTGEPHIRFYAGVPLVTPDNQTLGTLCVIDRKPRELSESQLADLRLLARQVFSQLEARRNLRLLRQTAEQLENQRSENQLILDHVPAYVFYKDSNNILIRVNQAVADSLGLSAEQIEGRSAVDFYPEHAATYHREDLQVLRAGVPMTFMAEPTYDQDGTATWISTDKIPIKNPNGVVDRVLVVAKDVTQLKETEVQLLDVQEQLRRANDELSKQVEITAGELEASELRYADLYHNAPDMFASIDIGTRCVGQCNDTLLRETGMSREEVIGKPVSQLYHESCRDRIDSIIEELSTNGHVRNREMTLRHRDGSSIEVSLSVSAFYDAKGRLTASRSVWRDITEKKRLEEENEKRLTQLAHLSRVATMNEMASGVAHELNQPLYAIKNYAQGSLRRLRAPSPDTDLLVSPLEEIVSAADRAAELIAGLRRYAKPGSNRLAVTHPRDLAGRAMRLLQPQLKNQQIEVACKITDDLPPITCDDICIEQVLINLLINAAEAMSELNGKARRVELLVEQDRSGRIRFAVIDNGPGLSGVDVSRLNEAFYTTKKDGLGMGLAICRTILDAHGSLLEASSNADGGATFEFSLPPSKAEPKKKPPS